jgi:AraC family transcriptional regulator
MIPSIKNIGEKKLIGHHLPMSIANDSTSELWRGFMPKRMHITPALSNDLFCVQAYDVAFDVESFNSHVTFQKWAAVEVNDFMNIPVGMETFTLPSGLYAVFLYVGAPSAFYKTAEYIFREWLRQSPFVLDSRPHFQVMGEDYKGEDPSSQEYIYIPVKPK